MTVPRYRRSPHLLVELQANATVLVQCDTLRRFTVDSRLLQVLAALDDWTAPDAAELEGRGVRDGDWERLLEMGVVEREGEGSDGSLWSPYELAAHRLTNRGGARPDEELTSGSPPPPAFKSRGDGRVTALPAPDETLPASVGDVLGRRRTVRAYADRPLRLDELSTLLHHAARVSGAFTDGAYGECALHPYPGGGARSELELYVIACDVDGLEPGAHHYDSRRHDLVEARTADEHMERLLRWVHSTTGGVLNRDPQAMLLVTSVFARVMWKYQGIGLSLVYKDAGCLLQTLYLVATAMGLAPCALGGGEEAANSRWLGLDPLEESQVGLFLIGPRRERSSGRSAVTAGAASPAAATEPGDSSVDRILRMSQGFLASGVLRAGLRLGFFDRLAGAGASASEVAAATHADARGARILLDALVAMGLAQVNNGTYTLSAVADRCLVADGPAFIGGMVDVYADDVLWEALRTLPEAVQHGGSTISEHVASTGHPYWERLAKAVDASRAPAADAVAAILAPLLDARGRRVDGAAPAPRDPQPTHVLDIGCGNGGMLYALAARNRDVEMWLLDWPDVVSVARQRALELGLGARTHFIEGDMTVAPLGGPYDLILLSQVLHNVGVNGCRTLLRRCAASLRPDGILAVHDLVLHGSPREDPAPYLFSVITLAWTPGGEVRSVEELDALLRDAGLRLRDMQRVPGAGTGLLIAEPQDPAAGARG